MISFRWHPKQRECFDFKTRNLIAVCGRTFGKTRGVLQWLVEELHNSYADIAWYVSITNKQAETAFRYLQSIANDTPGLREIIEKTNKSSLRIYFTTGKEIHFRTAEIPANLRGENTLGGLVLDEAGLMSDEIPAVIRPSLSAFKCRTVYIGTPYGYNWYYNQYLEALENKDFTIARYTSWDNPLISKEEHDSAFETIKKTRGEQYARQEMYGEFNATSMSVFQNVDKCITMDVPPIDPLAKYSMGIDVAVSHDDTAIVVINKTTYEIAHIEVYNKASWECIGDGIYKIWQRFGHPVVYQDCSREEYAAEELESRFIHNRFFIERIKFTVKNKNDIIGKASDLIANSILKIPATEMGKMLVNQLNIYERYTKTSGYESMKGRGGKKDDLVTAMCLACIGVRPPRLKKDVEERKVLIPQRYLNGGY